MLKNVSTKATRNAFVNAYLPPPIQYMLCKKKKSQTTRHLKRLGWSKKWSKCRKTFCNSSAFKTNISEKLLRIKSMILFCASVYFTSTEDVKKRPMSIGLKSLMSNKPVTSSVLMIRGKEDHAD
jgi:hypothetical protein